MATINYTKTDFGNGKALVVWDNLSSSDVAQPYEIKGDKVLSIHVYKTSGTTSTGNISIYGSNLSTTPDPAAYPFGGAFWTSHNSQEQLTRDLQIGFNSGDNPFNFMYRWVYPINKISNFTCSVSIVVEDTPITP